MQPYLKCCTKETLSESISLKVTVKAGGGLPECDHHEKISPKTADSIVESRRLEDTIQDRGRQLWRKVYRHCTARRKLRFGVSGSRPAAAAASASEPSAKGMASVPPVTISGKRNCFVLRRKAHRSLQRYVLRRQPKFRLRCIGGCFRRHPFGCRC